MAQKTGIDEQLSIYAIEEAENIWKIDLDLVPDREYINSPIRSWDNPPPKIDDKDFQVFGLKMISLIEDEILRLWILNRSDLFAILKEHAYPRPLIEREERQKLLLNLARNKDELKWAAIWLIWKKIGGFLEEKEKVVFKGEVSENIPIEYQELQKTNRKESEDFLNGKRSTRIRIAEIGEENLKIFKCLGLNNNILNKTIAAVKLLNKDLIDLKNQKAIWEKELGENKDALKNLKELCNRDKNDLDSLNEMKLRLEKLNDNYTTFVSNLKPLGKGNLNEGLWTKKMDFLTRAIKRMEPKVNFRYIKDLESLKKDKEKARKFYELRQKKKKSKNLNAVREEDSSEKENSSLGSNSFLSQSMNRSF